MTPKERKELEEEESREWGQQDRGAPRAPYEDPFSIAQIVRRHEPKLRVGQRGGGGGGGGYGYY